MERKPKPKLSEVLAALVSSVAQARSAADGEAMRIACMYQKHELLRGLPVPRMRLVRVTVGLPLMVAGLVDSSPAERAEVKAVSEAVSQGIAAEIARTSEHIASSSRDRSSDDDEREAWETFVRAFEHDEGLKHFLREFAHEYREQLACLDREYGEGPIPEVLIRAAAGDVAGDTLRRIIRRALAELQEARRGVGQEPESSLGELLGRRPVARLIEHARSAAWSASLVTRAQTADLRVAVETEELKNSGGGPEVVTRLQMTLLEEGLEWLTQNEDDGSKSWKLVTE